MEGLEQAPLGRVLILGLGVSGKAVARYCAGLLGTRVSSLFIAAGARTDDSVAFVETLSGAGGAGGRPAISCGFGDDALARFAGQGQVFDLCVASPGIPFWHELYATAQAISGELVSEVELAWRESDPQSTWVAITGTNGKTTTTACCASVLRACGYAADAVGNIGDTCLDAVAAGKTRVYVAEVSSYQLYSTRLFAPDVAVLLGITPDHVHWHVTLEAYRDAKFKLVDNMLAARSRRQEAPGECRLEYAPVAVLDATNDAVRAKVRELKAASAAGHGIEYIALGTADGLAGDMRARCGAGNAAFVEGPGMMRVAHAGRDHALLHADELQIKGRHNALNALAAAAVAVALGAPDAAIADALRAFAPLEHRIEPCGTIGGVECYNDSKATNVDAAVKALEAFPNRRIVVLLGGDDKGTDLSELVHAVAAHACAAVCFGAAGERMARALEEGAPGLPEGFALKRACHMADALEVGLGLARPGDVLLLSPGCASFDEFSSFEHRGREFKRLVAEARAASGEGPASGTVGKDA